MIRRPPRSTLFPSRRSSDLIVFDLDYEHLLLVTHEDSAAAVGREYAAYLDRHDIVLDRKSTRLNSSHVEISYAVFCLKKKTSFLRVTCPSCFIRWICTIHPA